MKLAKQQVVDVEFRTKGKWYDAKQVDDFLDELTVATEAAEQELSEAHETARQLTLEVEALRKENAELRVKLEESAAQPSGGTPERELPEQERARLLEDIKALRAFRERFREAVARDIETFSEETRHFASDDLLQ